MGAPIPVCAGCGLDTVPADTALCVLCRALVATATPFAPTGRAA